MRTVGVEEEMLLVDMGNGRPRSVSGRILVRLGRTDDPEPESLATVGAVEGEFKQEQIETHTPPVEKLDDLEAEIRRWRREAVLLARETGSRVAALGTSPLPAHPHITRNERYLRLVDRFGVIADEHLTCGCHVHVSVESDEEGVGVLDRIRVWTPVLLGMGANSPFHGGVDTGYASYRTLGMGRWPTAGPAGLFGTAETYHRIVDQMLATGVLLDPAMLYFHARLSHHLPTVEIRTPDVTADPRDVAVLAALARGLVDTAADDWRGGTLAPQVPTALLRLAEWQAAKGGVDGMLLDPRTHEPAPALEVVRLLVDHVGPALERNGDLAAVEEGVERLRTEGNGATRQRRTYARTGRLVDVVAEAVRATEAPAQR